VTMSGCEWHIAAEQVSTLKAAIEP
jgi:hypothetical protein